MKFAHPLCIFVLAAILGSTAMADRLLLGEGESREGGIRLQWSMTADADQATTGFALLDVTVSDSRTGAPVPYDSGALLGWLQRHRTALIEPDQSCSDRVMSLATQGIGQRGDIDMNGYRIVTLNTDGSIAFINPFVGFNNAKLESIIDLNARPIGWAQLHDRMEYWVLLADPGRLVAVDLQTRSISRMVALPPDAGATAVIADPATQTLWIAMPDLESIGKVDLRKGDNPLELLSTKGLTQLFAAADGAVLGWSDTQNHLTLFHGSRRLDLASRPISVLHSTNAAATVIAGAEGSVTLVPDDEEKPLLVTLDHALQSMILFDADRRALAVGANRASVIDLATHAVTLTFPTEPGAGEIALTEKYAYVLGAASGRASMIALDDLIRARPQVLDIIVSAITRDEPDGSVTIPVVPSPDGDGLLLASFGDGIIYQYSEGMMAPSGSYSNYRRAPVGIGIVDYALRRVDDGHYRAALRIGAGGRFDLLLGGIGPRISSCSTIALEGDPSLTEADGARIHAALIDAKGGEKSTHIAVRVLETRPDKGGTRPISGLDDVKLLIFDKHTGWQRRVGLLEFGAGDYQAEVPIPRKGNYALLVSSPSANLSYVEGQIGDHVLGGTQ